MKPIELREKARKNGESKFFTGKACKNDHISHRSVATGRCLECNAANTRRYYKRHGYDKRPTNEFIVASNKAKEARETAIAEGKKVYRSGRDCQNGHTDPLRSTANSGCRECTNEYNKKYRPKKKYSYYKAVTTKKPKKVKKVQEEKVVEVREETYEEMVARVYKRQQNW